MSSRKSRQPLLGLTPDQSARLNTWIGEIALDLCPGKKSFIDSQGELRIGNQGSLGINPNGRWIDRELGVGNFGAASLVLRLMDDAPPSDARQYVLAWLIAHAGKGTFGAGTMSDADDEARERQLADYARDVLARMAAITPDTASHRYLESRHLLGDPLSPCMRHLEVGRQNESALVGLLTNDTGEVVAIQLGHLLIDGGKSPHVPTRNQYKIDPDRAESATFTFPALPLPADPDGIPDVVQALVGTLILCEGLENAASLSRAFPYSVVKGIPGIGRLQHLLIVPGQNILMFADGDGEDKPAARKALARGLDHLILADAKVKLAMPPLDTDANALLIQGGIDAIHAVVATAADAVLSVEGYYLQAARASDDVYELNRRRWAKEAGGGIRVTTLDKERERRRKGGAAESDAGGLRMREDIPHPDPVPDIASVCEEALTEVSRYMVADPDDLAVAVMWNLGAHFVHHSSIELTRFARLEIGAEDVECGKSTLLEICWYLMPRALPIGGSISAPAYFRAVDEFKATVLIDEAHDLFKAQDGSQSHLLRILRSGHTRNMAWVVLTEPLPNGGHKVRQFSTWTAIAYTVIGQLRDAGMRSRAISIRLIRALEGELRAGFDEGESLILDVVRQKFARWAADQPALPTVSRPAGMFNRRWNNWAPLMRIAALVGGEWPDRILRAARRALTAPAPSNSDGAVAILTDVRRVFIERRLTRIESDPLCEEMLKLKEPSAEWSRINRARSITPYWLRDHLKGLLHPPKVARWTDRSGKSCSGYKLDQFQDAFSRYLPPLEPDDGEEPAEQTYSQTSPRASPPITPSPPTSDFSSQINGFSLGAMPGAMAPQTDTASSPTSATASSMPGTGTGGDDAHEKPPIAPGIAPKETSSILLDKSEVGGDGAIGGDQVPPGPNIDDPSAREDLW